MPEILDYHSKYGTYKVVLSYGQYGNGRLAIQLKSPEGEPVAVATVNIPEAELQPGEILVKTWSENERMLEFLETNGIVRVTDREVPSGFVTARVCEFLRAEDAHA